MNNHQVSLCLLTLFLIILTMGIAFQPVAAAEISDEAELNDSIESVQKAQNDATIQEPASGSAISTSSATTTTENAEITVESGRVITENGTRNVRLVVGVTNTTTTVPEGISGVDLSIEITAPDESTETFSRTTNTNGITTLNYTPALNGTYDIWVESPDVSDSGFDEIGAGPTLSFFPGWHDVAEIDRNVTVGVGILDGGSPVNSDQRTVNISTPSGDKITKTIDTDQTGTATFEFTPKNPGDYHISGDSTERPLNIEAGDITGKAQFNGPFADNIKSGQTAAVYGQLKDDQKPYANKEINVSIINRDVDSVVYSELTSTNDQGQFVIDWVTPTGNSDLYRIDVDTQGKTVAIHGTGIDVETTSEDSEPPSASVDLSVELENKDYSPAFKPGEQVTAKIQVTNGTDPVSNAPIEYRGSVGYPGAILVSGNTTTNSTGYASVTFTIPEDTPLTNDFELITYTSVNNSTFEETEYGEIRNVKFEQDNGYRTSPGATIDYSTTATSVSTGNGVADVPTQVFLETNAFHASVTRADLVTTGSDGTGSIQFTVPNQTGELFFGDWGPYRSENIFSSFDSKVYDLSINSKEEYAQGETVNISYTTDTSKDVSANVLVAAGDDDYEQVDTNSGLLYSGRVKSGENVSFTVPSSVPTGVDYDIAISSSTLSGNRTVETDEFDVVEGDDTESGGGGGGGGLSAPAIAAPSDFTYDPSSPFTLGTSHNATGIIDDSDVAVRLVNVTNGNNTEIALNDSSVVPVDGHVTSEIEANALAGDVTIETQLYNTSTETAVATARVNLTASGSSFVDVNASDLPGSGTANDPYEITNASELQAMEDDLDANYTLVSDIDASNTAQWHDRNGFDPVGTAEFGTTDEEFKGSLYGYGRSITGLTINRSSEGYVGLIGSLDSGTVKNISLVNVNVVGDFETGGLAGNTRGDSTIEGVTVSGTVNGSYDIGGVVGAARDNTTIQTATASVDVTDDGGDSSVGGLVGGVEDDTTIQNSMASGSVTGEYVVGGLVGRNDGTIQSAKASGSVNGISSGFSGLQGGLVGTNSGIIRNAAASGSVAGTEQVGGLVGDNSGTIQNSTTSGSVVGTEQVGGLVGASDDYNGDSLIQNVTALGNVTGDEEVGGLAGVNRGTIQNTWASGTVDGNRTVGGLVGRNNNGSIQDTFAVGFVKGSADVGGLVANNTGSVGSGAGLGTVTDSYWDTETTKQGSSAGDAIGLTTAEMTGEAARTNMSNLSFGDIWQTQVEDYPTLTKLAEASDDSFTQLAGQIDTDNDNRIGDFEVLQAIEYWRTNQVVPNTDQRISDQDVLTLIDMWQEETEVAA